MLSANTGNNLANCIFGQNPIVPACYYDCGRGHGLRPVERWSAPGAAEFRAGGTFMRSHYRSVQHSHARGIQRPISGHDRIRDARRARLQATSHRPAIRRQPEAHQAVEKRRPSYPARRRYSMQPLGYEGGDDRAGRRSRRRHPRPDQWQRPRKAVHPPQADAGTRPRRPKLVHRREGLCARLGGLPLAVRRPSAP